ncbi:MAG TPA: hypothetical protein VIK01_03310 [Polyangiaceae bacterium]
MNKSSILTCALAIGCLQACAGHSIDLDQGASPAPNGTDPVGVDVIQLPDSISYLGADDARVYWTTPKSVGYAGAVLASSVAQSCVFDQCNKTLVSYGPMQPPLTIGRQDVFFASANPYPSGRLVGCPKAGCGAAPNGIFEDPGVPEADAVDDQYLYWSSDEDIYRCPLTGCTGEVPEVVAKDETTNSGLIVDGDTVFWTFAVDASDPNGETQIHSAPKDGSRPPTLIANGVRLSPNALNFTVDGTNVYWLDSSSHVQSCARTGCNGEAPVTLVATDGAKQALRVDATGLYWLETAAPGISSSSAWASAPSERGAEVDVSVRFCPLTGCSNDADVHVLTASKAGHFAMSSKYLYWDEPEFLPENGTYAYGDNAYGDNKQIFRLAKPE